MTRGDDCGVVTSGGDDGATVGASHLVCCRLSSSEAPTWIAISTTLGTMKSGDACARRPCGASTPFRGGAKVTTTARSLQAHLLCHFPSYCVLCQRPQFLPSSSSFASPFPHPPCRLLLLLLAFWRFVCKLCLREGGGGYNLPMWPWILAKCWTFFNGLDQLCGNVCCL